MSKTKVKIGAWCAIPTALSLEGVARAGFDWVCIDMQHGAADYERCCEMVRAADLAGATPIVRVPWNDPGIIGRVLDAGALGIIVPMIETAHDAQKVVNACLYPPAGRRSFGPLRAALRDGPGYFAGANDRIAVLPMIETREALHNVAEIMAVPGVSGAFVGPMDLSVALGLQPKDNDGEAVFDQAIERVVQECRKNSKIAAVYSNAKLAALRARQGFQMISITNDFGALMLSVRTDLASVKNELEGA